ncbi:MAG: enoyl-CoA hydratase/isomerase family protein [Chloroflexi bacterium]|nr:enoyl-CoA hydratase/isomerase family protein [Chloroflexota bacterium]
MNVDLGTKDVVFDVDGAVAVLRFNRPQQLNAVNSGIGRGVVGATDYVRKERSINVLVVTGEGRGFCSGADLGGGRTHLGNPEDPQTFATLPPAQALALLRLEKPVIGAINGVAAGMGFSLALACDIRIAAQSARFSSIFIKRGLGPDNAISFLLPRLIGSARACELMLTGDIIGAEQALAYGIVNRVVPDDKLMDETLALARRIAAGPGIALQLTKQSIYRGLINDAEEQVKLEYMHQHILRGTADHREGVKAFQEKREARFQGR